MAYEDTCKVVSHFIDNVPNHKTGAAIDMMLFDRGGVRLLDLGMFDTIYGDNPHEENFSRNVTSEQLNNRMTLLSAATKAGFLNYGCEWWHYSYGDRAWAYVKRRDCDIYDVGGYDDCVFVRNVDD